VPRARRVDHADAALGDDALHDEAADHLPEQRRGGRGLGGSNRKERSGIAGVVHRFIRKRLKVFT
jgi:hypothetical protein